MYYNKALETGTLTGVVLSQMMRTVMPPSMRSRLDARRQDSSDRRQDRRHRLERTITGYSNGRRLENLHLIDISRGGLYVETDSPHDIGPDVYFDLSGKNLGPFMRVKGWVTRRAERGIAVRFS
jgi:hypothetical protein